MKMLTIMVALAIAFFGGTQIHSADMRTTIAVAQKWETIAMEWKRNSDAFESIAKRAIKATEESQKNSLDILDEFYACNSMLPKDRRL